MKKKEVILIGAVAFLGGLLLGIFFGPLKGGIGNNSGNTNNYYGKEETCTDDDTCECGDGECGC